MPPAGRSFDRRKTPPRPIQMTWSKATADETHANASHSLVNARKHTQILVIRKKELGNAQGLSQTLVNAHACL